VGVVACAASLAACKKDPPAPPPGAGGAAGSAASLASSAAGSPAAAVAEALPRCRPEGARLTLPGDDVIVGDAVASRDALWVGVIRREGSKRVASVLRASLDLATSKTIDVGPAMGDDPPPSPRLAPGGVAAAFFVRANARSADAGADRPRDAERGTERRLSVARLEAASVGRVLATVAQQADESLAFDVAWPRDDDKGDRSPLVAWDEDAPLASGQLAADRGVVKVALATEGAKARIASPESSDAESPRLLARPGGFWLAWLARKVEPVDDAGASHAAEGPGERRAYRWVELVALDAKGEAASPVRRVSPEKGRVASFDLASVAAGAGGGAEARLVVFVQDEAARVEGGGERLLRYRVDGDKIEAGELVDAGVSHSLAEIVPVWAGEPSPSPAPRWLAFADVQERARLVPFGPGLDPAGSATVEPSIDGARVVAASGPDVVYAAAPAAAGSRGSELRRLVCR